MPSRGNPPDPATVVDDFEGDRLNRTRWLPAYLPAWSSLREAAACWAVRDSLLQLSIPLDHPVWCEGDHQPPLRVSAVQSGNFSGPEGSSHGQQPYRQGLRVREEQAPFWGWTPQGGTITVRARARVGPGSMFSFWLVGREVEPRECAEICIAEIFGDAVAPDGSAEIGSGIHAFRDTEAREDFATTRRTLDPSEFHDYAVRWSRTEIITMIDGDPMRRCERPPFYPMQLIMAEFEFPETIPAGTGRVVPMVEVDRVVWVPLQSSQ